MHINIQFPHRVLRAYTACCKPLCRQLGLPQTALDILLFFANNPGYHTARDVVEVRGIKANLVSVNVERLVREGLLERRPVPGDRRKTRLVCTAAARPAIRRGQQLQADFFAALLDGISPEALDTFRDTLSAMDQNLDKMLKGAE